MKLHDPAELGIFLPEPKQQPTAPGDGIFGAEAATLQAAVENRIESGSRSAKFETIEPVIGADAAARG